MRKAIFFTFVVIGAAIGLVSALEDEWGVRVQYIRLHRVSHRRTKELASGTPSREPMHQPWQRRPADSTRDPATPLA